MKTAVKVILIGTLVGMLLAGVLVAFKIVAKGPDSSEEPPVTTQAPELTEAPTPTLAAVSSRGDFSDISERFMPAVVAVNVTSSEVYQDFFGRKYEEEYQSNASGIIVACNPDELLIVTNNHVVEGAKQVSVVFNDGSESKASVKAVEPDEDLAVISVSFSDIKVDTFAAIRIATLGDSDSIDVGEMVVAIGNALGYGQSTTVGYISAVNREVEIEGHKLLLIQTDAAINPGNSGGALLNARGEVIGINNAKLSDTSVEGMCYAIPISTAIPVIENLIQREVLKESEQASIGIVGQEISAEYAEALNMPQGIYIKEVKEGSNAEKAGLKPGYIITRINGSKTTTQEEFENVLSYTRGGSQGTVTVMVLELGVYSERVIDITFGKK